MRSTVCMNYKSHKLLSLQLSIHNICYGTINNIEKDIVHVFSKTLESKYKFINALSVKTYITLNV